MHVGVFYFNPDYGIDISELARELEERSFASLYVPEHTHIPTSRRTPFPRGGDIHRMHGIGEQHRHLLVLRRRRRNLGWRSALIAELRGGAQFGAA